MILKNLNEIFMQKNGTEVRAGLAQLWIEAIFWRDEEEIRGGDENAALERRGEGDGRPITKESKRMIMKIDGGHHGEAMERQARIRVLSFVKRSLTTKTKYHREYHSSVVQLNTSAKRSSGMCYIHIHTHTHAHTHTHTHTHT